MRDSRAKCGIRVSTLLQVEGWLMFAILGPPTPENTTTKNSVSNPLCAHLYLTKGQWSGYDQKKNHHHHRLNAHCRKLFNKVAGVFKQKKEGGGRMNTSAVFYANPTTPSQVACCMIHNDWCDLWSLQPPVSVLVDVPAEGGEGREEGGEGGGAMMRTSQSEGGLAGLVKRGLKGQA